MIELPLDEGVSMTVRTRGAGRDVSVIVSAAPDPGAAPPPEPRSRYLRMPGLFGQKEPEAPSGGAQDGAVVLPGLDPDEVYVVHAFSDDGLAAVRRGARAGASPIDLDLEPIVAREGWVTPAPEEGEKGVVAYADPGLSGAVPIGRDGRFAIGGLPAGTFRLRATITSRGRVVRERVFLAAGPEVGEVTLPEGAVEDLVEEAFDRTKRDEAQQGALLDAILHMDPAEPNAGAARAKRRHEAGDDAGARSDVDHVLAVWPRCAEALALRADLRSAKGEVRGAIADGERAIEAAEDASTLEPGLLYAVAWRCEGAGLLEKARKHVERAVEGAPRWGQPRALLCEVIGQTEALPVGTAAAEAALVDFPSESSVQVAWSRAYRREGRSAEVLPRLDAWIDAAEKQKSWFLEGLRFERVLARIETGDAKSVEGELVPYTREDNGWYEAILWLARARQGKAEEAKAGLLARLARSERGGLDAGARRTLRYLVGQGREEELLAARIEPGDDEFARARNARGRAQAAFFVAEKHRLDGDREGAIRWYGVAAATDARKEMEHTLALNALRELGAPSAAPSGPEAPMGR